MLLGEGGLWGVRGDESCWLEKKVVRVGGRVCHVEMLVWVSGARFRVHCTKGVRLLWESVIFHGRAVVRTTKALEKWCFLHSLTQYEIITAV